MERDFTFKDIWNSASVSALILGVVTITYSIIIIFLGRLNSDVVAINFIKNLLVGILWAAKVVVCIMFMKYFMSRFLSSFKGVTRNDLILFGFIVALLSAFVYSAFSLFDAIYIEPDRIKESLDLALEQYSNMLDANSMDAVEAIKNNLPQLVFWGNLIYCTVFGLILSLILAGKLVSNNIFDN